MGDVAIYKPLKNIYFIENNSKLIHLLRVWDIRPFLMNTPLVERTI